MKVFKFGGASVNSIERIQNIPNILKHYPDFSDGDVIKLLGTTKATITAIRNKTHKNIAEIKPQNPVTLGLCTQAELDALKVKYRSEEHTSELQSH